MNDLANNFNQKQMKILDTPLGHIYCSASSIGLVSLSFFSNEVETHKAQLFSDFFKTLDEEIKDYFKGSKIGFTTAVDLSSLSGFQREVLAVCQEIPYGEVRTYGGLAKTLGKPGAAQAVGGALARNPIPLVIPCHRVVAADGSLHGYSAAGGLKTKNFLLAMERANLEKEMNEENSDGRR